MNGIFREAQGRALLVPQTERVIKFGPKRYLYINDLVDWRVSFSDVDLPFFCVGSLPADLGYWKSFPLSGRRLKPCTKAVPGAALWTVASFSSSQCLTHAHCTAGTRNYHNYIANKAAVWTLAKELTAYRISNAALPLLLHHAGAWACTYWKIQDVQSSRSSTASQLVWDIVCVFCMFMLDEEDSPLWQHSVPSLHLSAPKTCNQWRISRSRTAHLKVARQLYIMFKNTRINEIFTCILTVWHCNPFISICLFVLLAQKKGSVKVSGNCIGKQWPLPVTILEKMDGNYVNYEPARNASKVTPKIYHPSKLQTSTTKAIISFIHSA